MNREFHVAGGKARGAQQSAQFLDRFEPLKPRISNYRKRGVNIRITADLVGVSCSALYRYLKLERECESRSI